MAQIVQTLQQNDILFGDLHLRNLMIRPSKDLILTDFGFSFMMDKKTGKAVDKVCHYKWMTDQLTIIEKNNSSS